MSGVSLSAIQQYNYNLPAWPYLQEHEQNINLQFMQMTFL